MSDVVNNPPEGWQVAKLTELTKVAWGNTSLTKKTYVEEGYPAYSAAGQDGFVEEAQWKGPAVVLSAIGARCGRCFYADGDWTAIKNTIVIQGDMELINHKFLYYYLNDARKWKISGSGQPFITLKTARETLIPIAPLKQQERMVAKIEELFSHIDAGIEALKKTKQLLKQYRQSVLKAAVTGELTKEWREQNKDKLEPASQLLERILTKRRQEWEEQQLEQFKAKGKMPKNDRWKDKYKEPFEVSSEEDMELPNLWARATLDQVSDLISGQHINSADYTYVEGEADYAYLTGPSDFGFLYPKVSKWTNTVKSVANKGDVLVTAKGSGVGKTNILDNDNVVISRQLMALRPFIDEWYVYIFLEGRFEQLQTMSTGTAIPGISRDTILSMAIALPSLEEQNKIKVEFDRLQSIIDRTERSILYHEKKAITEKESILRAAFSGKLVSTHSNESSYDLLDKIKSARKLPANIKNSKTKLPQKTNAISSKNLEEIIIHRFGAKSFSIDDLLEMEIDLDETQIKDRLFEMLKKGSLDDCKLEMTFDEDLEKYRFRLTKAIDS